MFIKTQGFLLRKNFGENARILAENARNFGETPDARKQEMQRLHAQTYAYLCRIKWSNAELGDLMQTYAGLCVPTLAYGVYGKLVNASMIN